MSKQHKCGTCRFFQEAPLASSGWCHHPQRKVSSDLMIMVRKNELACRDEWAHDLWEAKTDQQGPAAVGQPFLDRKVAPATESEIAAVLAADSRATPEFDQLGGNDPRPNEPTDIVLSELGIAVHSRDLASQSELERNRTSASGREPDQLPSLNPTLNARTAIIRARETYRERARLEASRVQATADLFEDHGSQQGEDEPAPMVTPIQAETAPRDALTTNGTDTSADNSLSRATTRQEELRPRHDRDDDVRSDTLLWPDGSGQLDDGAVDPPNHGASASLAVQRSNDEAGGAADRTLSNEPVLTHRPHDASPTSVADDNSDFHEQAAHVFRSFRPREVDHTSHYRDLSRQAHPAGSTRFDADDEWSSHSFREYSGQPPDAQRWNPEAMDSDPAGTAEDFDAAASFEDDSEEIAPAATFDVDGDWADEDVVDNDDVDATALPPEYALSADLPRICRTCRDFRPAETGDRGWCANRWAFSHRRVVAADEPTPCEGTLGHWWLPVDEVWADAADVSSHGQPTPLLDAWLPQTTERLPARRRS